MHVQLCWTLYFDISLVNLLAYWKLKKNIVLFKDAHMNLGYLHSLITGHKLQPTSCEWTCYKFVWYTGLKRMGAWAFWLLKSHWPFFKVKRISYSHITLHHYQPHLPRKTLPSNSTFSENERFIIRFGNHDLIKYWKLRRVKDARPWKKMLIYHELWKGSHLVLDWKSICHDFHSTASRNKQ